MARQKQILWLASKDTPLLHDKREQLKRHHFSTTLVLSLAQLTQHLKVRRVPVIMVSEGEDYQQTLDFIMALGTIPDARGSRWVFVLSRHDPGLISLAACANFRDVIPLDLPDQQWLHRVLFSSAGRSLPYPLPMTHITLDHPARLYFPGRIVWISRTELRLECPLTPPSGSLLTLSGKLFSSLSPPELTLKVGKTRHSSLNFRFSTAIQVLWSHSQENQDSLISMIQSRSTLSGIPKYRIYLAVRGQENRDLLLSFFSGRNYDVNTALQLKNLVSEPLYYTPDLIILDEFLCRPPHHERFEKMLDQVRPETPLLILGGSHPTDICEKYPDRKFHWLPELTENNLRSVVNRCLSPGESQKAGQEEKILYFEKDDPFSCVFGVVQGRLSSVHPYVARISSPYPFKNFTLCRVDSPFLTRWLGKETWIKITEAGNSAPSQDSKMLAGGAGFLADCSAQDKNQLARGLSLFIAKVLRTGLPGIKSGFSGPAPIRSAPVLQPEGGDGIIGTTRYYDEDDTPQSVPHDIKIENSLHEADTSDPVVAPMSRERKTRVRGSEWSEPDHLTRIYEALSSRGFRYFVTFLVVSFLAFQAIRWLIPTLAKSYKKSGSVYVDQIEKFQKGEKKK